MLGIRPYGAFVRISRELHRVGFSVDGIHMSWVEGLVLLYSRVL
jgi:hypothetical protein